jgi:radical SAM protein with 4Fe4S-binding SPASM domain
MLTRLFRQTKPLSRSVIFEVTQKCNSDCLYCYNVWKDSNGYPACRADTLTLKRIMAKAIDESGARHAALSGGEPCLRADLEDLVGFLKKRGCSVVLITNALLLDKDRIKRLISSGVDLFELPLLSDKRQVHNELMRCDAFDLVARAIVTIKNQGGRVVSVFVATGKNIGDFAETAKMAFALGVNGIMLNRFNPGGEGTRHIDELLPSLDQVKAVLGAADKAAQDYGLGISCSIPIQPCLVDISKFKNLGFGFCSAGTDRSYYTFDEAGNVRMCNHSRVIIGNILHERFKRILAKTQVKEFMAAVPEFCLACARKSECQGGCKASSEVCYGDLCAMEPFLKENHALGNKS